MIRKIQTVTSYGMQCQTVTVEAHISRALPRFIIVGLADAAVQEARERVTAACDTSGYLFPRTKVTVNLAPADVRKEGTSFDLPIALSVLAQHGHVEIKDEESSSIFVGELSLKGEIRPIRGAIAIAAHARSTKASRLYVPFENAAEAALITDVDIRPVKNLSELVEHLQGKREIRRFVFIASSEKKSRKFENDFLHVRGQEYAKRVLEIAAAGGHNVLFSGPPGSGKTLLAKCFASILPEMSTDETLEVTKIYSYSGLLPKGKPLIAERPFRAPHHSASQVSLVGGGSWPKPGEITLAHKGVLFLDELPEFPRQVLDALRQPLEEHLVTISRAQANVTYPAEFILVAACNPCPCGYFGYAVRQCICRQMQIQNYQKRLSGPLLDRIDVHISVTPVEHETLLRRNDNLESSEHIRQRVSQARKFQLRRTATLNAHLSSQEIEKYCPLSKENVELLRTGADAYNLSSRAVHKVIKVARTIADLEACQDIRREHIMESLQYRKTTN